MGKKKNRQHNKQHIFTNPAPIVTQEYKQQPTPSHITVECHINNNPSPEKKWADIALHNRILIGLTFGTVLAGTAVTWIYGWQLNVMRQTLRTDQRPWIKVTADFAPIEPLKRVVVNVHTVNNGKTPAKTVEAHFIVQKIKNGFSPDFKYSVPHLRVRNGVFFPNVTHDAATYDLNAPPLTQQEFDDYLARKIYFVMYANVEYADFFHIKHWTHICIFQQPTSGDGGVTAYPCSQYNDVDDN